MYMYSVHRCARISLSLAVTNTYREIYKYLIRRTGDEWKTATASRGQRVRPRYDPWPDSPSWSPCRSSCCSRRSPRKRRGRRRVAMPAAGSAIPNSLALQSVDTSRFIPHTNYRAVPSQSINTGSGEEYTGSGEEYIKYRSDSKRQKIVITVTSLWQRVTAVEVTGEDAEERREWRRRIRRGDP